MSVVLNAVRIVLEEANEPLHSREITQRILARGLWRTEGKTPDETVSAQLSVDIINHAQASLFQRTGKGIFALRAWGLPEFNSEVGRAVPTDGSTETVSADIPARAYTFTDAAEKILEQFSNKKPMHYRNITKKALELGLIRTVGQTPEATLHAQIGTEIERMTKRGETPRFIRYSKGLAGLSRWMTSGSLLQAEHDGEKVLPFELSRQIEQHNNGVRKKLHDQLHKMLSGEFEALIGELLGKLGFEEVAVTNESNDKGIDVRGTLVVGDVIHVRMAVQVKRWKENVHRPTVQQVRGSLGTHEQGLI